MTTHIPPQLTSPTLSPSVKVEREALAAMQVEYDVLSEVIAFARQLCDTHQLSDPVQAALITPYQTRCEALVRQLQLPDQLTHLADLEQARTHLIQTYESKLAEITITRTSLQTGLTSILASPAQDRSPLSSRPPLSPEAPVRRAVTFRKQLTSVIRWMASTFALTWSVTTPQYEFSVLPHVPLYPILLTIGLGLFVGLVTRWHDQATSRRAASVEGMLYALVVGVPFLATWIVCSRTALPTWPAALAGLVGPSLLLLHAYHPSRIGARILGTARIRFDEGPCATPLTILASLFHGYGSVILAVFLATTVTYQPFSPTVVAYLGGLILVGAALSSGLFYML
jgi:hypothetical protein